MSRWKLFAISFALTVAGMLVYYYATRTMQIGSVQRRLDEAGKIRVSGQIDPAQLPAIRKRGYRAIVDVRPDGEADGQPSSDEIRAAAQKVGVAFHYIPVPHEAIPDDAVQALGEALQNRNEQTLLYCRTGRRAVWTFSLVEASRAGGPDAKFIMSQAVAAGFPVDDLKPQIEERIAKRPGAAGNGADPIPDQPASGKASPVPAGNGANSTEKAP